VADPLLHQRIGHLRDHKKNLVTFLLFADKYDCEYDGWDATIIEAIRRDNSGEMTGRSLWIVSSCPSSVKGSKRGDHC
jgi:hypothetical protein